MPATDAPETTLAALARAAGFRELWLLGEWRLGPGGVPEVEVLTTERQHPAPMRALLPRDVRAGWAVAEAKRIALLGLVQRHPSPRTAGVVFPLAEGAVQDLLACYVVAGALRLAFGPLGPDTLTLTVDPPAAPLRPHLEGGR